jgi:hypothetical protein
MAPMTGPPCPRMLLPCEDTPASTLTRGRGIISDDPLSPLLLDALQTVSRDDPGVGERAELFVGSNKLVRCIYSDGDLRDLLRLPQSLVTSLTANYRAHPSLLLLPSLLFYGGSLESRAPYALTRTCLRWSRLSHGLAAAAERAPASEADGFPLLCIGVSGNDAHKTDSPSFWNPEEVSAIVEAVSSLIQESRAVGARRSGSTEDSSHRWESPLTQADIGVIAPYRQQVLKIRQALR